MRYFNKPWVLAGTVALCAAVAVLAPVGTARIQALQQSAVDSDAPESGPYDGRALYTEVFDHIVSGHMALGEKSDRDAFIAKWQHKYDKAKVKDVPDFALAEWKGQYDDTSILDNQVTADHAIELMLSSLGYLHDNYERPSDIKRQAESTDPTVEGIGAAVSIMGTPEAIQNLERTRPDPKDKEGWKRFLERAQALDAEFGKISDAHPLVISAQPDDGSPALTAGLRIGDALLEVSEDDQGKPKKWVSLNGLTISQAVALIRGKVGTVVHLKVRTKDATAGDTPSEPKITRGKIIQKVVTFKDLGDCVSYVSLNNFESRYGREELKAGLDKAVNAAKACTDKGQPGGVVLNFRNNPGGDLHQAESLESMLMEYGNVLVRKDRTKTGYRITTTTLMPTYVVESSTFTDNPKATMSRSVPRNDYKPEVESASDVYSKVVLPPNFKIVALINGRSASGSELLSGTLQGEARATIIGEPSFGKGCGQVLLTLRNGGVLEDGKSAARVLRLTVFEFIPAGKPSDHIGVVPDIFVPFAPAEAGDDWIMDSQVKAAKAELLRQLAADADYQSRRTQSIADKKKTYDGLVAQKRHYIEKGEVLAAPGEEH